MSEDLIHWKGAGGGGERTGRVCYDFIPVQDKSGTTLSHMDTMDELTQWMNLNMIYCVGGGGGGGGRRRGVFKEKMDTLIKLSNATLVVKGEQLTSYTPH